MTTIRKRAKQRTSAQNPAHDFTFRIEPTRDMDQAMEALWVAGVRGLIGWGIPGLFTITTHLEDLPFGALSKTERRDRNLLRTTLTSAIKAAVPETELVEHSVGGKTVWVTIPTEPASPEVTAMLRKLFNADEIEENGEIVDSLF